MSVADRRGNSRAAGHRIVLSWSGGKDSALALAELLAGRDGEVAGLLTTVTEGFDRVSMHGVRAAALRRQAAALDLPLHTVSIPQNASNLEYEARMGAAVERLRAEGTTAMAYGDLFLADIRAYREKHLTGTGITPLFPLWLRDTRELAERFIAGGFQGILTCVDTRVLDPAFAGRPFDRALLADLPPAVDPCGENGEFHTFVFAGPIFREPIPVTRGEVVRRDRWCFCDLIPA